jgi:GDP-D-mannose dehydratase
MIRVEKPWGEYSILHDEEELVENLRADASKAKRILNWEPKTDVDTLVKIMVNNALIEEGLDQIENNEKYL